MEVPRLEEGVADGGQQEEGAGGNGSDTSSE